MLKLPPVKWGNPNTKDQVVIAGDGDDFSFIIRQLEKTFWMPYKRKGSRVIKMNSISNEV